VVSDLEGVGMNLHDHASVNVIWEYIDPSFPSVYTLMLGPMSEYDWDGTGVLSASGLAGGAFFVSPFSENNIPDIQLTIFPRDVSQNRNGYLSISVTLNRPLWRTSITLQSNDPTIQPIMGPLVLTSNDLNALAWGVSLARNLTSDETFSQSVGEEIAPGPNVNTTSSLIKYIQSNFGWATTGLEAPRWARPPIFMLSSTKICKCEECKDYE